MNQTTLSSLPEPFVIIATKGRAKDCLKLVANLAEQTLKPSYTLFVGTEDSDVVDINYHPWINEGHGDAIISPKVGLTSQRNFGIETLEKKGFFKESEGRFFCAFFDDDYRMAPDWLEKAAKKFQSDTSVVGLTGKVLADGACTGLTGKKFSPDMEKGELTEDMADAFISGDLDPVKHWASGKNEVDFESMYGCNMAFIDTVIRAVRFDENLPFYGWQEDRDYTGMAKKYGRTIYYPECRGVHLATKSGGRSSGNKFGYSQIANVTYLMKKGTMGKRASYTLMTRNVISNIVHSAINNPTTDYRGRLKGNITAFCDLLMNRCNPKKILDL